MTLPRSDYETTVYKPGTGSSLPRAVVFDCYGTLLRVVDQRRPYLRLARIAGGRLDPSPMIEPLSLADVVARNVIPIEISGPELRALQLDLEAEVASIAPIADAVDVLAQLRRRGYRLGVASNLAQPYAEPIERLLGGFIDAHVFSFEVGATKPSPIVYDQICERLKVSAGDALMVGDSIKNDQCGAIAAGLQARHLPPGSTVSSVLRDLL